MRIFAAVAALLALGPRQEPARPHALPVALPNDNGSPAGTLRNGVLTLSLVATDAMWHPDGDTLPGKRIAAFAEEGRAPLAPGPLVRVPGGTELRLQVHNPAAGDTLTFGIPAAMRGGGATAWDSVIVPPGQRRELRVHATVPGSYLYRARGNDALSRAFRMKGILTGAIIVDSVGTRGQPRERIMVLLGPPDSVTPQGTPVPERSLFAINGRSWPHTERLVGTVGDTLRWRMINASPEPHPMHLHGFYYRVEESAVFEAGPGDPAHAGRMVVTERMPPFSTMTTAWVPERAGNWLFHCHFQEHVAPVDTGGGLAHRGHGPQLNHALTGMRGLVVGVVIRARPGDAVAAEPAPRRRLRVTVVRDSIGSDAFPSMRYVPDTPSGGAPVGGGRPGVSPPLFLVRGEPVAITVVNRMPEPTSVHWHGMELESYYDGVPGFSGNAARLSPVIAPGDSFVARFTPPRAGTFMYHSHVDEPRTHQAGLVGALVVREPGDSGLDDHSFVLKTARAGVGGAVIDVNGRQVPDTIVLHAGRPARLRFINLTRANPNATVWLTTRRDSLPRLLRDTLLARWRPVAKDGADLPAAARAPRPATQLVSIGETYDFEFTPAQPGILRIEVRAVVGQGALLNRVPIRVE